MRNASSPLLLLTTAVKTSALAHILLTYAYAPGLGQGPSMIPLFPVSGQWFIISKSARRGRGVRVGDVVVYEIPARPGEDAVKRVVGMGGDYVLLNSPGGVVVAAGEGGGGGGGGIAAMGPGSDHMIQVPGGHCYLVGDNLPWSRDSREYGPVPFALVRGRVVAKCFPFSSWNPVNWFRRIEENGLKPVDGGGEGT